MIDKATVDRIYAAADIVEIVSDYVTLKKKGVNYQACCPFHNEKTPSFVVSPTKGLFKCFGCGKGGNAVTFVMEHESMSYVEALKTVARKYGIEVQERPLTEEEERRNDDRESMMALNGYAGDWFADYLLRSEEGVSVGLSYFRSRGFTDATIRRFGLGFCPAVGDRFSREALAAGYKEDFLLRTGLTIRREDGRLLDRFFGRVIFPIHTISGRIVAFGGRTLRTDKKTAKYVNSPESEVYSKKAVLYGLFQAKRAIQQNDCALMVEGYADVISMHQAGVENVVASSGTSLTVEHIQLIKRFTRNMTVIYDGDSAGIKASIRGIDMILNEGMNVRVVRLPEEDDPDTFARRHTSAELQEYIRVHEQDFITFKAGLAMEEAQRDPIRRAELIAGIVRSIAQIPDPIPRAVYTRECSRLMEIDEEVLLSEVARERLSYGADRETTEFIRRQQRRAESDRTAARTAVAPSGLAGSGIEELERELAKYLLKYGHLDFEYKEGRRMVRLNVAEIILSDLEANGLDFTSPLYREVLHTYRTLFEELGAGTEIPAHHFTNHPDPQVCNAAVDLLTSDDNYIPSKLWEMHDIAVESERERLGDAVPRAVILYKSKAIEQITARLRDELSNGAPDEERTSEILHRIAALNKERTAICRRLSRTIL